MKVLDRVALFNLVSALDEAIQAWDDYAGPCDGTCPPDFYCQTLRRAKELTQAALDLSTVHDPKTKEQIQ